MKMFFVQLFFFHVLLNSEQTLIFYSISLLIRLITPRQFTQISITKFTQQKTRINTRSVTHFTAGSSVLNLDKILPWNRSHCIENLCGVTNTPTQKKLNLYQDKVSFIKPSPLLGYIKTTLSPLLKKALFRRQARLHPRSLGKQKNFP